MSSDNEGMMSMRYFPGGVSFCFEVSTVLLALCYVFAHKLDGVSAIGTCSASNNIHVKPTAI